VLLTVRPRHLRFMGGAAVFPGGAVADADLDARWEQASALTAATASGLLDLEDAAHALAAFVCALREAFEEVGLLLGEGPVAGLKRSDADDAAHFLERCLALGVTLSTDRLTPAGRWVTPLGAPVRFDARFFVAEVPAGWEPVPDPDEVAECRWVAPSEALAEVGSGHTLMAPPTVEMLQRLDGYERARDAIVALGAEGVGSSTSIYSTRLSPLVRVVLAPNPSFMTGPGTNTYVVGAGPTVVIDPAVPDERFVNAVLESAGRVVAILVTHRHSDHVGGVAAIERRTGAVVRAFGTQDAGGAEVTPIADGDIVESGNARLVALHTPGHASDHICFVLEGAASLFSGDTVLGEGTAVIAPPDGDMRAYLQSLERLRALDIDRIYPGHWRPLDGGRRVIENYIAHRNERARAIVAALGPRGATIDEVVATAYADTPAALHPIAAYSATAHLQMLEADGRVKCVNDRWVLIDVE